MNLDKLGDAVLRVLSGMQSAIETAAPAVWGAALKQAYADGLADLMVAVLACCASLVCLWQARIYHRRFVATNDDDIVGLVFIFGALCVVSLAICMPFAHDAVRLLIGAEWQAIMSIRGLVVGGS